MTPHSRTRRNLLKFPLAALAAQVSAAPRKNEYDEDNTKIATMLNVSGLTDDQILFYQQIGLRWVHAQFGDHAPYDLMKTTQDRLQRYGIKIHCGLMQVYRTKRIQLGQPGRDEDIAQFQTFIRDCGRLGIPVVHIDFHPGNTYTTSMVKTPRGYESREFDLQDFHQKVEKQMFDRQYSAADIWANYTYFLKAVLPVAEQANVHLAHHPDDPPIPMMNGVAKVFINYEGYKHAEQVAANGSKNWGLCLCVGTWLEGGDKMGKDVVGMIKDFGSRGKIFSVHFRNVSSPLPRFHETFQDDGYMDMYQVMKALREVRCNASLIPDHYPGLTGDQNHRIDEAYMISQMRTLLRRANEEIG